MMRRSFAAVPFVLLAALAAAGCDNGETPVAPTPGPTVTETFTGSLTLNGSLTHSFVTQGAGTVTATITTVDPSGSIVGFVLGTSFNNVCTAVSSNDTAVQSSFLSGTTISASSLCVKLHDPNGTLTAGPVNYTVTVVHP
jgi:hypothetical protein